MSHFNASLWKVLPNWLSCSLRSCPSFLGGQDIPLLTSLAPSTTPMLLLPHPGHVPSQVTGKPLKCPLHMVCFAELHEHDCFSTQTDFREMPRTSARFRPGLQGAWPGSLQSLGPTSAHLCAVCGGSWTVGVGTAALHPHAFLLLKPHCLFFHFTDLVSLGLSLHMIPFYHFCGLSEEPTVSLV